MKQPVTRVIRNPHYVPPAYDTAGVPPVSGVWQQATPPPKQPKRRHWFRRVLVLLLIVAGAAWAFQQVDPTAGHLEADLVRRVLGDGITGSLEATYRTAADEAHTVKSQITGEHPPVVPTVTSALPLTARNRVVRAAALPTPVARHSGTSEVVLPATSGQTTRTTASPPRPAGVTHTVQAKTKPVIPARVAAPVLPASLRHLPASALIPNNYQVYETWNNCGPASLSMALSYFGINESQQVLGELLRPYENSTGDNDDKDVTFEELANEARTFGLLAYYRPDGNMQLLKRFLAIGLPVVAETVMTKDDDIGHYRVVKGYDENADVITQDDSMQGHNVPFSYADFDYMWKKYNYEYLVLVPKAKQGLAEAILGKDLNVRTAWQKTVKMDEAALAANPGDVDSTFNLSVADYYVGNYQGSVNEFEKVQSQLPFRTLWYQIEPIEAYYALGDYQQVFSLTASILNNGNRAFSQLYILRGDIDKKEGDLQAAKAEFQNAVFYNIHLKAAQDALNSVSS